jgi:hypothetical protein
LSSEVGSHTHKIKIYPANFHTDFIEQAFSVTVLSCSLVQATINPLSSSLGERKEEVIAPYTFTNPTGNYLTACGAITYELDGGNTLYLSFVAPDRKLIVYSTTSADVSATPKLNTMRAYPSNMTGANKTAYTLTQTLSVTISGPCAITNYSADRKDIPLTSGTPSQIKYLLGAN